MPRRIHCGIGDDIHLAISRIGDEVDLGCEPSRPVDSPHKTTSAPVQCRFGTFSVSSLQLTGKLLGLKTVFLEQVYTAYSQLVTIAGLWHGLKQTSNQRRCPDFHLCFFDLGLQFWLLKRGCQNWSPTRSQKLLTSNPASVHAQIL